MSGRKCVREEVAVDGEDIWRVVKSIFADASGYNSNHIIKDGELMLTSECSGHQSYIEVTFIRKATERDQIVIELRDEIKKRLKMT